MVDYPADAGGMHLEHDDPAIADDSNRLPVHDLRAERCVSNKLTTYKHSYAFYIHYMCRALAITDFSYSVGLSLRLTQTATPRTQASGTLGLVLIIARQRAPDLAADDDAAVLEQVLQAARPAHVRRATLVPGPAPAVSRRHFQALAVRACACPGRACAAL